MVDAMTEPVRRLGRLFEDPHPGLATWNDAVGSALRALCSAAGLHVAEFDKTPSQLEQILPGYPAAARLER